MHPSATPPFPKNPTPFQFFSSQVRACIERSHRVTVQYCCCCSLLHPPPAFTSFTAFALNKPSSSPFLLRAINSLYPVYLSNAYGSSVPWSSACGSRCLGLAYTVVVCLGLAHTVVVCLGDVLPSHSIHRLLSLTKQFTKSATNILQNQHPAQRERVRERASERASERGREERTRQNSSSSSSCSSPSLTSSSSPHCSPTDAGVDVREGVGWGGERGREGPCEQEVRSRRMRRWELWGEGTRRGNLAGEGIVEAEVEVSFVVFCGPYSQLPR
jgi:hypothetical protein